MADTEVFIFAGGGTGGHLFPGIAVAEELLHCRPAARAVFVGSHRQVERRIVCEAGFEHFALPVESTALLKRNPLRFAWNNWRACRSAGRLLDDLRPRAVVGLGGFASVPVVRAAAKVGVRSVLLEQNAIPGRATRFLARRASSVCLSFAGSAEHLPRSIDSVLTGNPVRAEIANLFHDSEGRTEGRHATILVLGGSQGARAVNDAALAAFFALKEPLVSGGVQLVHQTGADDVERVREQYREVGLDATVAPFFHNMPQLYRRASLVVSRAGATTLAEIACARLPSILIPFPNSVRGHQRHNALAFTHSGAAELIDQGNQCDSRLAEVVERLLRSPADLDAMSAAAAALALPDAVSAVVDCLLGTEANEIERETSSVDSPGATTL